MKYQDVPYTSEEAVPVNVVKVDTALPFIKTTAFYVIIGCSALVVVLLVVLAIYLIRLKRRNDKIISRVIMLTKEKQDHNAV